MSDKPNARGEKTKTYQLRVSQITALNPPPSDDVPIKNEASSSPHDVSSTAATGSSKASVRKLKNPIKRALPKFASSDEEDGTPANGSDNKQDREPISTRTEGPKHKRFRLTNHPERTTVTRSKNVNNKQKTSGQAADMPGQTSTPKGKEKATEIPNSGDDDADFEEFEAMVE